MLNLLSIERTSENIVTLTRTYCLENFENGSIKRTVRSQIQNL